MEKQALMTQEEKSRIYTEAYLLSKAGKKEEAKALEKSIPVEPWVAEFFKKYLGLEALLSANFNLSDVEKKYGKEWLTK